MMVALFRYRDSDSHRKIVVFYKSICSLLNRAFSSLIVALILLFLCKFSTRFFASFVAKLLERSPAKRV